MLYTLCPGKPPWEKVDVQTKFCQIARYSHVQPGTVRYCQVQPVKARYSQVHSGSAIVISSVLHASLMPILKIYYTMSERAKEERIMSTLQIYQVDSSNAHLA